ncbi:hypothetical protein MC04F10_39140 [Escherichia coli]
MGTEAYLAACQNVNERKLMKRWRMALQSLLSEVGSKPPSGGCHLE